MKQKHNEYFSFLRKALGMRSKIIRIKYNLSQQQLSNILGICTSMISLFENGRCNSQTVLLAYLKNLMFRDVFLRIIDSINDWRG